MSNLARKSQPQPPENLAKLARAFRMFGLVGLSLEGTLAFVTVVSLLFAASGRNFSPDANASNGIGIFWAISGILSLCVGLFLTFRYSLIGRALLKDPDVHIHPKRSDALKLLRVGIVVGGAGILLGLLGGGTSIGVMIAKTVSQPPGVAITDPNKIVRALDVFVMLANLNLIAAHFVGAATSLWLMDRTYHYTGGSARQKPSQL